MERKPPRYGVLTMECVWSKRSRVLTPEETTFAALICTYFCSGRHLGGKASALSDERMVWGSHPAVVT